MRIKNTKFFIDKHNNVYKSTNNNSMILKISPWEIGEDRRIFNFEKKEKLFKNISFNKAMELINKQFANYERKWVFNGKKYKILKNTEKGATYLDNRGQSINKYEHEICKWGIYVKIDTFYLCWFRGKIYWMESNWGHYPRIQLYKFENINKPPSWEDFCQWTNVKNCKVIYEDISKD